MVVYRFTGDRARRDHAVGAQLDRRPARSNLAYLAGRKLVQWGDALVSRIPVVRSIYSSVKQVSDTLFSESGNAFRTAVLVQWPREGVWTVAFVTGAPSGEVAAYLRDEFVSVNVPTTPNPTGGYFVMLRKSECIELEMSVDAALRYIVSMGVVAPSDPVLVAAAAR